MENGYVESFNGRFRDECLNRTGSAIWSMRGRRSRRGSGTTTNRVRTALCSTVPQWSSQRRLRASTELKWGEQKPEKVSLSLD